MVRFCQSVIDIKASASAFKSVTPEPFTCRPTLFDLFGHGVSVAGCCELRTIVGENLMDFIRHNFDKLSQKVSRNFACCPFMQLNEGDLRGTVNRDKHIEFAFFGAKFGNVDVEVPDGILFELFLWLLVAIHIGQPDMS